MVRTMPTSRRARAVAKGALACLVTLGLAFPAAFADPDRSAWADEAPAAEAGEVEAAQQAADEAQEALDEAQSAVDDAQSTLDDAEGRAASIASDYEALEQEVAELQARIDETAAQAMEAQTAVVEGRNALAKSAAYEYVNGGAAESVLSLLFESSDFGELLRNLAYLDSIMRYQADEVAAQKERSARFDALVAELNSQKDAQDAKLAELEQKRAEAEQAAAEASTQLQSAQSERSDQASRLEELKRKAEEAAAAGELSEPVAVEEANTNTMRPGDQQQEVQPDPAPQPDADEEGDAGTGGSSSGNNTGPSAGAGWSTGIASAYGGSTDPYTPNPGVTATGDVCDDWSMGVAVPMAWDRYWQYYGRTVEISYNGITVFAIVNDCGYMGGGSRSLDLQPGVWKAFGYSSCTEWGLRTVQYRFL